MKVINSEVVLLLIAGHLVGRGSVMLLDSLALIYVIGSIGIALNLWAAYIWVGLKNRKRYWCLLGLLCPIGIFPLAMLSYKYPTTTTSSGIICPRPGCGSNRIKSAGYGSRYECKECGKIFT